MVLVVILNFESLNFFWNFESGTLRFETLKLEQWNFKILQLRNFETLLWNSRTLQILKSETLEFSILKLWILKLWNFEILKLWNLGLFELCNTETLLWNSETLEKPIWSCGNAMKLVLNFLSFFFRVWCLRRARSAEGFEIWNCYCQKPTLKNLTVNSNLKLWNFETWNFETLKLWNSETLKLWNSDSQTSKIENSNLNHFEFENVKAKPNSSDSKGWKFRTSKDDRKSYSFH
jgi:hypothetical protein